jgi:hypothetical protein
MKRIPRPIIALAAPSADQPVVNIVKRATGAIDWDVKAPAPSLEKAGQRAVASAEWLILECDRLERLAAKLKQARADEALAGALEKSVEKGAGQ